MQTLIKRLSLLLISLMLTSCQPQNQHFTDQANQPLTLSGHWLVINYWATWCKPCRQEVPELNQLHERFDDQGIKIIGVNFDQLSAQALIEASTSLGIAFPVLSQDPARALALPKSQGLPVTYIVSPSGRHKATLLGEQSAASIEQRLAELGALTH